MDIFSSTGCLTLEVKIIFYIAFYLKHLIFSRARLKTSEPPEVSVCAGYYHRLRNKYVDSHPKHDILS